MGEVGHEPRDPATSRIWKWPSNDSQQRNNHVTAINRSLPVNGMNKKPDSSGAAGGMGRKGM